MRDERVVAWKDLRELRLHEIVTELALPLPWLAIALYAGSVGWVVGVVAATLAMFMTGLRVTHNAFHRTLGVPRQVGDAVMFGLSILLGGSMHAIECTHLHHHRHCLAADDVEGRIAALGFWQALTRSPAYPLLIHVAALACGTRRQRRWIAIELSGVALAQGWIWLGGDHPTLKCMTLALVFANLSAAMIGIWAVHHRTVGGTTVVPMVRSRVLDALTVNMLFHAEHHAYPAVPTCHLPALARRIHADSATGVKSARQKGGARNDRVREAFG